MCSKGGGACEGRQGLTDISIFGCIQKHLIKCLRPWQASLHVSGTFIAERRTEWPRLNLHAAARCCLCTVICPDVEALKPNFFSAPSPPLFSGGLWGDEATVATRENHCLPFVNTGSVTASDSCTRNIWVNDNKFSVTSLELSSLFRMIVLYPILITVITECAPLIFLLASA